jgi:hypothetical protein
VPLRNSNDFQKGCFDDSGLKQILINIKFCKLKIVEDFDCRYTDHSSVEPQGCAKNCGINAGK